MNDEMNIFVEKLKKVRFADLKKTMRLPKDKHKQLIDLPRKKFICLVCKEIRSFEEEDYRLILQEFRVFKGEHRKCSENVAEEIED